MAAPTQSVERTVVEDAARGLAPRAISARRDIPIEQVRELARSKRDPLEDAADPLNLRGEIERWITYSNALLEDYQRVFEEAEKDVDRLRALAGRRQVLLDRLEHLGHFGLLPRDPDVWARVPTIDHFGRALARALFDHGLRGEDARKIIDAAFAEAKLVDVVKPDQPRS